MAIPKEILSVKRPSSTVVKHRGGRYVVIKRTSRRVGKRVIPIDTGAVGEIVDGRYVAGTPSAVRKRKRIDIKDYGEVTLCNKLGKDLFDELRKVWDLDDAKRLYTIALLRAAYGDVKNRDLQMHYETSFASEMYPGVHLSEKAVSAFLLDTGQAYSLICEFMRNRVKQFAGKNIVIDGMLKDYNSQTGTMSEFSRKGSKKGSKDMSILYAFSPEAMEPIAAKPYAGNMLDQKAVDNFVTENKIEKGLMIFDKGFFNKGFFDKVDKIEGLSYLIPLKQDSALIKKYGMDNPTEHLEGYKDATVLFKKVKMKAGGFLYSFRDPGMAFEQEVGYVQKAVKKKVFKGEKYEQKKSLFGLIVFKSKADVAPLVAYQAYAQRWDIEVLFDMFKNIIDRDTVNVHGDYRAYATEFINFLSTIITSRVKKLLVKKEINKNYSYKQVFKYLAKYKKVKVMEKGKWESVVMLKYIEELVGTLDV